MITKIHGKRVLDASDKYSRPIFSTCNPSDMLLSENCEKFKHKRCRVNFKFSNCISEFGKFLYWDSDDSFFIVQSTLKIASKSWIENSTSKNKQFCAAGPRSSSSQFNSTATYSKSFSEQIFAFSGFVGCKTVFSEFFKILISENLFKIPCNISISSKAIFTFKTLRSVFID